MRLPSGHVCGGIFLANDQCGAYFGVGWVPGKLVLECIGKQGEQVIEQCSSVVPTSALFEFLS